MGISWRLLSDWTFRYNYLVAGNFVTVILLPHFFSRANSFRYTIELWPNSFVTSFVWLSSFRYNIFGGWTAGNLGRSTWVGRIRRRKQKTCILVKLADVVWGCFILISTPLQVHSNKKWWNNMPAVDHLLSCWKPISEVWRHENSPSSCIALAPRWSKIWVQLFIEGV